MMDRNAKLSCLSTRRARRKVGAAALLIGLAALAGWSVAGSRVIAALNPALRHELAVAMRPALDVWIMAPDYAGASPMIISTPAGMLYEHDTLTVPQGSTVSAHLAEQDGDTPRLMIDRDSTDFTTDTHGDYAATARLMSGDTLAITRGSRTLASWKIAIVPDDAPHVAMTEPLTITAAKTLRVAYSASDQFGVNQVALRITPDNPLPGADNRPVEIALPVAKSKEISRVDFTDLTARPWAGQPVAIQLVATNQAGKRSLTDPQVFVVPERSFFNPVARVLIEERKKLLQHPDEEAVRDEAANIMAGIAHETGDYHGDPVILMALRSGAVRLILDPDRATAVSVNDLLWQAATRLEDGNAGEAEQMLHDARQDLADAIDRNAGPQEIQALTDRLQQAMALYVSHFGVRQTAHEGEDGDGPQAKLFKTQ